MHRWGSSSWGWLLRGEESQFCSEIWSLRDHQCRWSYTHAHTGYSVGKTNKQKPHTILRGIERQKMGWELEERKVGGWIWSKFHAHNKFPNIRSLKETYRTWPFKKHFQQFYGEGLKDCYARKWEALRVDPRNFYFICNTSWPTLSWNTCSQGSFGFHMSVFILQYLHLHNGMSRTQALRLELKLIYVPYVPHMWSTQEIF